MAGLVMMHAVSDQQLMSALAAGDVQALGELYRRYGRMVRAMLWRKMRNRGDGDIEDLCQEVFLTVLNRAADYQDSGRLRAWLCAIARRKSSTYLRNLSLRRSLFDRFMRLTTSAPAEDSSLGGASELAATGDTEMSRALAALPASQREVLLLFEVEELSGQEIAEALGIRVNAVWTRLHRARAALQKRFKGDPT